MTRLDLEGNDQSSGKRSIERGAATFREDLRIDAETNFEIMTRNSYKWKVNKMLEQLQKVSRGGPFS